MAKNNLRLDSPGIAAVLASGEVAAEVQSLGRSVAARAMGHTFHDEVIPVRTRTRIASGGRLSPRTAVDVSLAHWAGMQLEGKEGILSRAASSVGLQVRSYR
jgi:hypothetical protein